MHKSERLTVDSNQVTIDLSVKNVNQLVLYAEVKALEDSGNIVDLVNLKFNP